LELAYQGGAEMVSLNRSTKPEEINYTEKTKYKKSVSNNPTSNDNFSYNNYKRMSEKNKIVRKCYRCGSESHLAPQCNHLKTECGKCHKIGHLAKVCKFNPNYNTTHFLNVNDTEQDDNDYEEIFSINEKKLIIPPDCKYAWNIVRNTINHLKSLLHNAEEKLANFRPGLM
ncbi:unnamed protein product, partial [Diamesa hyperborea]